MKKIFRILLYSTLFLLLILAACWLIGVDRVDYTPYFETEYYRSTIDRLEEQTDHLSLSEGLVSIGMARVNITPVAEHDWDINATPLPLAGYGDRDGQPAQGLHDSLYVKVVVLKVNEELLAILAADLLIIPPEVVAQTQAQLTTPDLLPREKIFYSATHTHSSLGGWSSHYVGEAFAGPPNPAVINWLAGRFAKAIDLAIADIRPGRIAHGEFAAPGLVLNRLVGDLGTEHSTCSFLYAQQQQGRQAVIGIFDAHATTLSGDNLTFSSDYPAYYYQQLQAAGIDLPVFCAGSVGSHGPEATGRGFEKARNLGEALADSLLSQLGSVTWQDSLSLATASLELDLPPVQVRVSDHWRLAPFIVKKLFPAFGEASIQSARIGNLIWNTTPADFSGELAIPHKDRLNGQGFSSTITSFNGAYIGYVVPQKYYYLNEYESRVMSWFGPNMTPYLNELLFRMNEHLVGL